MPITWNESLATGSTIVDRQHKSLFAQLAALADAMKHGKGRHEIAAILDFLGKYVVEHFAEEEKLMDAVKCPVAAVNKQAHARLLSKYGELRTRFDNAGSGVSLVLEMHEVLSKWLVDHILAVDVKLRGHVGNSKQDLVGAATRS
jgi:hemerythrin